MCLQCMCESETYGEVLPGWALQRSKKHHPDWPLNWWGLVQCNDPHFVWKATPLPDPMVDWTEEQEEDEPLTNLWERSMESVEKGAELYEAFKCHPETGYELIKAAIEVGYDPEESGSILCWLFDYMGRYLESKQFIPDTPWEQTEEGKAWIKEHLSKNLDPEEFAIHYPGG